MLTSTSTLLSSRSGHRIFPIRSFLSENCFPCGKACQYQFLSFQTLPSLPPPKQPPPGRFFSVGLPPTRVRQQSRGRIPRDSFSVWQTPSLLWERGPFFRGGGGPSVSVVSPSSKEDSFFFQRVFNASSAFFSGLTPFLHTSFKAKELPFFSSCSFATQSSRFSLSPPPF